MQPSDRRDDHVDEAGAAGPASALPGAPEPPPPPDAFASPGAWQAPARITWASPAPSSAGGGRLHAVVMPAILFVLGLGVLAIMAGAKSLASDRPERMLGAVIAGLLVAGIVLVVLRRTMGPASRDRRRLIVSIVPAVMAVATLSSPGPAAPAPADPSSVMAVASPFTLEPVPEAIQSRLAVLAKTTTYAMRQVDDSNVVAGFILAMPIGDSGLTADYWRGLDQGIADGGASSAPTTFNGGEARLVSAANLTGLVWPEHGLIVWVLAGDEREARAIASAMLTAETPSPSP